MVILSLVLAFGVAAAEASDDEQLLALVRRAGFLTTDRGVLKPAWCPPCRHEMPSLQRLHDEFKEEGFAVLGVNVRELGGGMKSRAFAKELGLSFPMLEGPRYGSRSYDASPIPQTYIIDGQGRLLGRRPGEQDWTRPAVRSLVRALLDAGRPR